MTALAYRLSDNFKIQFKLPGRTTGVLSSGVVPYPNDPMLPREKYFKPKGLDKSDGLSRILFRRTTVYRLRTDMFTLLASPWNTDEYPRDYNGLRFRDYRVAAIASKKQYSKKAYPRWRAMRALRLAAALVLPDKGLKRCDYIFVALEKMRFASRDHVYYSVEKALVSMEHKIVKDWETNGRGRRSLLDVSHKRTEGADGKDDKILNVSFDHHHKRPIRYMSDIVKDII
ncbi:hypothetical protein GGI11_006397 [Coemansia sp. RSA 2049]|nr:hypothetical protein GGI11_006397 [Coemansia sp. RSA 2049]